MKEVDIAQIWRLKHKDPVMNYNVGMQGEYFIILSRDKMPLPRTTEESFWRIGCFWNSRDNDWGGARQKDLTSEEVNKIADYVVFLPELLKDG